MITHNGKPVRIASFDRKSGDVTVKYEDGRFQAVGVHALTATGGQRELAFALKSAARQAQALERGEQ